MCHAHRLGPLLGPLLVLPRVWAPPHGRWLAPRLSRSKGVGSRYGVSVLPSTSRRGATFDFKQPLPLCLALVFFGARPARRVSS